MQLKNKIIVSTIIIVSIALAAFSGNIMSLVKEPSYKIIKTEDNIQIREYPSIIVAQVYVTGERKLAISAGFKILADYIFGNNLTSDKINLASTTIQQQGQKIAMTAPVMQQELTNEQRWAVTFVMPDEYTIKTLPKPSNSEVQIITVPATRYAVITFSGLATDTSLQKQLDSLNKYLANNKLLTIGKPVYAFYNPPWTLPFLRRNEIMLALVQKA